MVGRLHQISVSGGGVPKVAVPEARIMRGGVEGDRQRDERHHGGPERAVCLFSLEVIRRLRAEGHPIVPGSAGENLTIEGIDWAMVVPGTLLRFEGPSHGDEVVLEVASFTAPCSTIRDSFLGLDSTRIKQELHPGESRVYARVVREGLVSVGDSVRLSSAL